MPGPARIKQIRKQVGRPSATNPIKIYGQRPVGGPSRPVGGPWRGGMAKNNPKGVSNTGVLTRPSIRPKNRPVGGRKYL